MTGYNQGDVILVAYPFGERAGGRRRPVLVISSNTYNSATGELIIAQVTSRVSAPARLGDYAIEGWKEANLPRPALVRARLATLKASLVLRRLGRLTEGDWRGVREALGAVIFI
jgi:mRNA interferase MazF